MDTERQTDTPAAITIHAAPTPTEQELRRATKACETTDDLGRKLSLRKLGSLQRLDLGAVLGVHSQNPAVAGPSALAFMVTHIDGDPVFPPNTYNELRALVGRLEDEGLTAIGNAAVAQGWATVDDDGAAGAPRPDAVKN
jgi:hypothetical protein